MRRSIALVLAPVAALLVSCGSSDGNPTGQSTPTSSASPDVLALVGRWERVVTCQELVAEYVSSGLPELSQYAWAGQTSSTGKSSFAPGSPKPTQSHPCDGALPRKHSHFFTASRDFGSLDWLGGQVDDGQYEIVDAGTVHIGDPGVDFTFKVEGDTLTLAPVLTPALKAEALKNPADFSDAGWAVSVAYEGHTWQRVPCDGHC